MINISKKISHKYNSKFLFYGLLLYLPIFFSQIGSRIPALAPLRLEFILGAILLLVIVLNLVEENIILSDNRLTTASIIFFAYLACTIPFSFVIQNSLDIYIAYVKFFMVYFMIISCINNEKRLRILVYVYLGCISLIFVEPFILSLKGEGFRYGNFMMRLYGITGMFDHPNQLGGITAANIPIFYYMIFCHKSKLMKLLFALHIIMGIRVIMLTQSRTAFFGAIAAGFFIWLLSKRKVLVLFLAIFVASTAWKFAPEETKKRLFTMGQTVNVISADSDEVYAGNREVGSMNSRWILLKNSLIIFLENPIFGVGIHNFASVSGRRWDSWMPPHCLYTEALSEVGLVGTLLFAYVIVLIFRNIKHAKQRLEMNNDESFLYYLTLALSVYLSLRLVVGLFGQDLYRMWWWIAGGFSVVILRIVNNKHPQSEKEQ